MDALGEVVEMLTGVDLAAGYDEGILGSLSYVHDIIARHSPLHDPSKNMEDTDFGRILEDEEMDNELKARLLLGLKD